MKSTGRKPRIVFLWVGRAGDSPLDPVTEEIVGRISRSFPALIRRVRPEGGDGAAAIAAESLRLLEAMDDAGCVWLCDREGTEVDSPGLSRWFSADIEGRPSPLVIVIGGAPGFDGSVRARAHRRLSFSPMTFPHALARLMAVEQVYRALTLREGVPYHK